MNDIPEPAVDEPLGVLPNLTVWTPEIDRLCVTVAKWIKLQLPGGIVYGVQRNGKTKACDYLAGTIAELLGFSIAVARLIIPEQERNRPHEREFHQEVLQQTGCARCTSKDISVLRRREHTHLQEIAQSAGSKRLLVIVDEAQNLHRSQFGYLIFLFNALEKLGIYPFFLLVGQPEMRNITATWDEAGGLQVIGRFFAREHRYLGVHPDEIRLVLLAFDEPGEEGGPPPLAKVFPAAYAAGWRLERLAPAYVEAVAMIMKAHNIAGGLRLPMQYFRASLLSILYKCLEDHFPLEHVTSAVVFEALRDAEFFAVLSHYVDRTFRPAPSPAQKAAPCLQ